MLALKQKEALSDFWNFLKLRMIENFPSEFCRIQGPDVLVRMNPNHPHVFHQAYQLHVGTLVEAFAGFNTKGGFVQWRVKALDPIMIFDEKHNIYVEVAD